MVNLEFEEVLPPLNPVSDKVPVHIPLGDKPHEADWLSSVRRDVASIVGPHVTEAVVDRVKLIVTELGSNANRDGRRAKALVLGRIVTDNEVTSDELLVGVTDNVPTWREDDRDRTPTLTPSKSDQPSKDLIGRTDSRDNVLKGQGTQGRGLGIVEGLASGPVHYSPERNSQGETDGKTVWVTVDPGADVAEADGSAFDSFDINSIQAI